MILKKILNSINPVEVIKVLKRSDKTVATKGYIKMAGGGTLITTGVTLVVDGASSQNWYEIIGGTILLIIGGTLSIVLANNVYNTIEEEENEPK